MCKTKCMTYFNIKGNFKIEDITEILGIKNTGGWNVGEKKEYPMQTIFTFSSWEYGTDYEETLLADKQIEKVIKPLLSKIEELKYIHNNYDCKFFLEQVQEIYNNEKPGVFYDVDVIKFCAEVGAAIDVDIYFY